MRRYFAVRLLAVIATATLLLGVSAMPTVFDVPVVRAGDDAGDQ